jgi:hypothetical protein
VTFLKNFLKFREQHPYKKAVKNALRCILRDHNMIIEIPFKQKVNGFKFIYVKLIVHMICCLNTTCILNK